MTEATESTKPTAKKERERWFDAIRAERARGMTSIVIKTESAARLIDQVETLEARNAHIAPLMEALSNAQEVIHLQFCVRDWAAGSKEWKADDEHWKECTEARAALDAAKEATS